MSLNIPNYRITEDDLVDADKKLARGISPLLDALNRCLGAVTQVLQSLALPAGKTSSFTTADNGAAYVDLGLGAPAAEVSLMALTPTDGSTLDSVYSLSWIPQPSGARLLFVGLAPLTTYSFKVRYL